MLHYQYRRHFFFWLGLVPALLPFPIKIKFGVNQVVYIGLIAPPASNLFMYSGMLEAHVYTQKSMRIQQV